MPLNSTMIAVALPDIARQFDHSPGTVTQALVASYLVAAIVLQSPGGKLGDRFGHWRMFAVGLGLVGLGALLGLPAWSLGTLAVARVLIAAGGAVLIQAALALMRIQLPPERRGRALGTFGAVMSLAAGIGPVVGGELTRWFGWPSVFAVNLPLIVVSALLAAAADRASGAVHRVAPPLAFDGFGMGLLAAMLISLVLGVQLGGVVSAVLLVAGLALAVPFVWWERRTADPVVALSLFASRPFAAGTFLLALHNLVMYTLLFELPQVLAALHEVGAAAVGQLLIFMMLAMFGTSLVAGRLVDGFGSRPVAVAGSVACLLGLAVLAIGGLASAGEVRLPLVLLGVGIGLATPAAQDASLSAVSRERSGMAAGMGSTMRYIGGVTGVAMLGQLLDLGGGRDAIIADHHTVLAVFGVALLAALVCALVLPRRAVPAVSATRASLIK